ncbi:hypothetical protein [Phyllobacterium sp. K27]
MSNSKSTINHDEIRNWVETRGGQPAIIRTKGDGGILRIDFGEPDDELEKIEWEDFFRVFDSNKLSFLYQDKTEDGEKSRFNKFISRD